MKERAAACCIALAILSACSTGSTGSTGAKGTPEQAATFAQEAEQKLMALGIEAGRADWIKSTYIIDDSEIVAAKLNERAIQATVDYAKQSTRFDGLARDLQADAQGFHALRRAGE